jgi:hypothetical protein
VDLAARRLSGDEDARGAGDLKNRTRLEG